MTQIELINKLKKEKNAVILAHYYENDEIQEIADYIGDSFYLSKVAKNIDVDTIIFCGVHFMAETAKILSPNKKVIIPVKSAGCFMADSITYEKIKKFKEENNDYVIVGYVNTTAKIKSLCDVCVTSANALKILKHYENNKILYIPDKNLATYANYLNKNDNIKYFNGYCDIHNNLTKEDVLKQKKMHPNAKVLIHPEAPIDVTLLADYIGSTKGMIDFVKNDNDLEYIVGTEIGILYSLEKNFPDKKFYKLSDNLVCKTMKLITLEDVVNALKEIGSKFEEIVLEQEIIDKALVPLNKMLELGDK